MSAVLCEITLKASFVTINIGYGLHAARAMSIREKTCIRSIFMIMDDLMVFYQPFISSTLHTCYFFRTAINGTVTNAKYCIYGKLENLKTRKPENGNWPAFRHAGVSSPERRKQLKRRSSRCNLHGEIFVSRACFWERCQLSCFKNEHEEDKMTIFVVAQLGLENQFTWNKYHEIASVFLFLFFLSHFRSRFFAV